MNLFDLCASERLEKEREILEERADKRVEILKKLVDKTVEPSALDEVNPTPMSAGPAHP